MTNLDSALKSRDITLPTKVCTVKAMVFPIVMYRCESWTRQKAELQRTDVFKLWCYRRLLRSRSLGLGLLDSWSPRSPWTSRRSNQSILKQINPEFPLRGLLLKLKLRYFGDLMRKSNSLEKTQMLGKIEGKRRSGWQRTWQLHGIANSMGMNLRKLWEAVKDRKACSARVGGLQSQTRLSNRTTVSIHPLSTHTHNLSLPTTYMRVVYLLQSMNTMTEQHHSKPTVHIRVHSWYCKFYWL